MSWSSKRQLGVGLAILLVILLMVGGLLIYKYELRPIVPVSIQKKLTFAVLIPSGNGTKIERSTVKYDQSEGLLSYVTRYNNRDVTVSEQAAPDVFSDVPDYYSKWLDSFGEYTSFNSTPGTVYLAKSTKLGPYPVAVMSSKGVLLFARPNSNLSEADWHRFFLDFGVMAG